MTWSPTFRPPKSEGHRPSASRRRQGHARGLEEGREKLGEIVLESTSRRERSTVSSPTSALPSTSCATCRTASRLCNA